MNYTGICHWSVGRGTAPSCRGRWRCAGVILFGLGTVWLVCLCCLLGWRTGSSAPFHSHLASSVVLGRSSWLQGWICVSRTQRSLVWHYFHLRSAWGFRWHCRGRRIGALELICSHSRQWLTGRLNHWWMFVHLLILRFSWPSFRGHCRFACSSQYWFPIA